MPGGFFTDAQEMAIELEISVPNRTRLVVDRLMQLGGDREAELQGLQIATQHQRQSVVSKAFEGDQRCRVFQNQRMLGRHVGENLARGARARQEDALAMSFPLGEDVGFAILSDGMGGHAAGDVASKIVVTELIICTKWFGPTEPSVSGGAMIPLVHRGRISAHANTLGGVKLNV